MAGSTDHSTSSPPIPSPVYCNSLHSPFALARVTNDFHIVKSKVHFSVFTFRDFSATHDTNTQLLFEAHLFSWLPTPPTSSLVTTPQITLCSSHAYLPSGPWTTISCVYGFIYSVPTTWYAFLLLENCCLTFPVTSRPSSNVSSALKVPLPS